MTSLRVVSLVFRGHDLRKIANINPKQEATLSLWKKLFLRESAGNRGTQREYSSKPLKHRIVKRILVFKQ